MKIKGKQIDLESLKKVFSIKTHKHDNYIQNINGIGFGKELENPDQYKDGFATITGNDIPYDKYAHGSDFESVKEKINSIENSIPDSKSMLKLEYSDSAPENKNCIWIDTSK